MSLLNPFYKLKYPSFSPQLYFTTFFLMSLLNPFYKLKYPTFSPRTILHSFLNAHNTEQYFSKGISEQVLFLMFLLNPFYKLRYLSFSPQLYFTTFVHTTISCKFPLQVRFFLCTPQYHASFHFSSDFSQRDEKI
jgi:hypothetical protein